MLYRSQFSLKKAIVGILSFMLAGALIFSCVPAGMSAYAQNDEMFIHAIYLGAAEGVKGDSVLLESCGEYLLMDCGTELAGDAIVNYLKKIGVTELSVYISHIHSDHRGGIAKIAQNFNVKKLYLPSTDYASEYTKQEAVYYDIIMATEYSERVYLKTGNTFGFGSVTAKVLGPVGSYKTSQFTEDKYGTATNHYINNYSLTTMFTGGGVKYLSCGDIEAEEENALLKKYSAQTLKATIYKLSHHGLKTSNTEAFVGAVGAQYNFEENCGHVGVADNGYYKTLTSKKNVLHYGMCIMVGEEKTSFIFHAVDGNVSVFRTTYSQSNIFKGWVRLRGADGTNRLYDYYYIGVNGEFYKGVYSIGGKKYYFDNTGKMIIGYYSSGKYIGWRTFEGEYRYFLETGEMYVGFKTIGAYKYCFDYTTGYRKNGDKYRTPLKIGSYYYAVGATGTIYYNGWYKYNSGYRYFDSNGIMRVGWIAVNKKTYYLDLKSGYRKTGLQSINGNMYWFSTDNSAAYLCKNVWVKFGSRYRYFNQYGKMAIGWNTIGGKKYYLDTATGLTKYGLTEVNGKYYWFNKAGDMYKSGWKKDSKTGNYRYFGKSGAMKTGWFKSGKRTYYLNPVTGLRSTGYTVINGKNFYFSKVKPLGDMYVNRFKKYGKSGGYRYYGKYGVMYTGWHTINGKKYYFNKTTGVTVSGVQTINGKTYYFNPSSKTHALMKNKWVYYKKGYIYFGSAGVRRSGWATIDGKHYYFDTATGLRKVGNASIGGKSYYFDKNGVLQ